MLIRHNKNTIYYEPSFHNEMINIYNCMFLPLYYITMLASSETRNVENATPATKTFTLQELATFDGSNGKPAYAAVNGNVYDFSYSPSWGGGTHFGLYAGKDLSNEFNSCHKILNILSNIPIVGILK